MKFWTYKEASDKVITDLDLQDQIFVTPAGMVGYANEGIKEASSEILKINEDYFLTSYYIPLVQGVSQYAFPYDIYGMKVRGIQYSNGTIIYPVARVRDKDKFSEIAYSDQYGAADDYSYYPINPAPNEGVIVLLPPARETAIVPPLANPFTPMKMWYIRDSKRIPQVGEYIQEYEKFLPTDITIATDIIALDKTYVTGDQVKIATTLTMPGGLTAGTVYYVISAGSGTYKLATTRALALAGTAIDITSQGTGYFTIQIAATQTIINNTLIDIPEFVEFVMQWMKCRCLEQEGDPRLAGATVTLEHLRKQMVDSLTQAIPDNDDTIQGDFSIYRDMSGFGGYYT